MSRRTNILARLRRWKTGAARYVVGAVVAAYLSAGVAPCAMADTHAANADVHERASVAQEGHAQLGRHEHAEHEARHGGGAAHDHAPADDRGEHCPRCPHGAHGSAIAHDGAVLSCFAVDDLTNVASKAKDASQPAAPLLGPAAFTLPPPLASPRVPPPLLAPAGTLVPLNVRHCVFLI